MKKLILLAVFSLFALQMHAQLYADGVKLDASNTGQYMEIDPKYKSNGTCIVAVDYGNAPKKEGFYITDQQARRIEFHSDIDVLNFLYTEGWELTQISRTENSGRRYMLKRRF
jgi:hypothetical protein